MDNGINMDLHLLKQQAQNLTPILRIGKNGLTEAVIAEVKTHLKKRGLIKIKILQAAVEETSRKVLAEQLAAKTNAIVVQVTGFIVVLYKKPNAQREKVNNNNGRQTAFSHEVRKGSA